MITKKELHARFVINQSEHGRTTGLRLARSNTTDGRFHYYGWIGDIWRGWVEMALSHKIIDPNEPENHDLSIQI